MLEVYYIFATCYSKSYFICLSFVNFQLTDDESKISGSGRHLGCLSPAWRESSALDPSQTIDELVQNIRWDFHTVTPVYCKKNYWPWHLFCVEKWIADQTIPTKIWKQFKPIYFEQKYLR